jgi:hypothetical protein
MFRWLLERPASQYGFLSGVFISLSTNALTGSTLAATPPANDTQIIRVASMTFLAGLLWFALGELVSRLRDKVAQNQEGIAGDDRRRAYLAATSAVASGSSILIYVIFILALLCSLCWPFI